MIRTISIILAALLLSSSFANAQSKAETRFYSKTISKPSLASFERFLKRYPKSVYTPDILARKDTLLNISPYTEAQAREIFAQFLPDGAEYLSWPERKEAVDYIHSVCISAADLEKGSVRIMKASLTSCEWSLSSSYDSAPAVPEGISSLAFCDSTSTFSIRQKRCYQFNYRIATPNSVIIKAAAYCPEADEYSEVPFVGKQLPSGQIEGRIELMNVPDPNSQVSRLLSQILSQREGLTHISEADYLSDLSIEWWLNANPDALTTAKKLSVNNIPEGSSLIDAFTASKQKANSAKYSASIVDLRGYSCIVVREKSSGSYFLAWAEPECADHYRDRLLNAISFDDSNSLRMNYYHGRKTFRYKLNLASKTIIR